MKRALLFFLLSAAVIEADEAPPVTESGRYNPSGEPRGVSIRSEEELRARVTVEPRDEDTLRVGEVDLSRSTRTLSFPARVEMREGIVEYAVVHRSGKVHETMLVTDTAPEQIHVAGLLLGMTNPPARVEVEITWDRNGPPARYRLEDLIHVSKQPMSSGTWHYAGSMFYGSEFAAAQEGSIVSIIRDPAALVENTRVESMDDTAHTPRTERIPATGFPVRVHIRLPDTPKK